MNYQPIEFKCKRENEELLILILLEHGLDTLEIVDHEDWNDIYDNHEEWIILDERKEELDTILVRSFVEEEETEKIASLREKTKDLVEEMTLLELTGNEDYVKKARENFDQIEVKNILITPSWKEYSGDKIKIILDPGKAFGTGQHETTKASLELMQEIDFKGKTVFDIGTGSGILAMASSLLGAEKVKACDIDEFAVEAAIENAEINKIKNIDISYGDLTENASGRYDIILSNILSFLILELMEELSDFIYTGSHLIFSGILVEEKEKMRTAFKEYPVKILKEVEEGDWMAFLLEVTDADNF